MHNLKSIDTNWTLFLDRDGVINHEKHLGYINTWEEFRLYDGVVEAFLIFATRFQHIFIITNQRGIARGITKIKDLINIHDNFKESIIASGGRIDQIYYCSDLEDTSPNRKPNPGMAIQAKKDHPSIDLSKSIMVGNTISDMNFGRNAGIAMNIFLSTTMKDMPLPNPLIDMVFVSLQEFAEAL